MGIYDRKSKNEQDAASKSADQAPPSATTTDTSTDGPKVETDQKSGADLAALNANGPGTEEAKRDAAQRSGQPTEGDDVPDGALIVAEGKSITSQRGILGPGTAVSEKDVSGGKERLDELAKAGTLVRKGEQRREPTDQ